MNETPAQFEKALFALRFIVPVLEHYKFRWVITGGFACYVYGVDRPITDIDIDIDISASASEFKAFVKELKPYIVQPLEHFVDQNYDNYNFEIMIEGQVIDICPMKELKIFRKETDSYEPFYLKDFPKIEIHNFHDIELPLLAKELIIKNKEMLVWQRESDLKDIEGLKKLLK